MSMGEVKPSSANMVTSGTYLREGAVVPDVAVVREAVAHKTQAALLDVLLDRVERLLLRDLHLRVRPARDLDDHVQDPVVLVREERDVMEGRDDRAIMFDEHPMVCDGAVSAG